MADQPPAAPPSPALVRQTDSLAIAALVVGIVSIPGSAVVFGFGGIILGIAAIVLGFTSRGRIRRSGGALTGGGLATAGWILGIWGAALGVAVLLILIGLTFAFNQASKGGA